jgi:outer membrane protein TolC
MHALRALALLAPLLWSCAGPSLSSRHHEQQDAWGRAAPARAASDDPFAGHAVLDRQALVTAVLARNPSVDAARWAWRAALARYPQETALDDPTLEYSLAPASVGASGVDAGQRVTLSQALPFPGKLALRGEVALAEAEAAASEFAAVRLRLATITSLLFDDYYLGHRTLEILAAHRALLVELREVATVRYETGEASQQDPLQAEVEEAHVLHDEILARTSLRIVAQQINGLLHRAQAFPIPPPPTALDAPAHVLRDREAVLARARAQRPELLASERRVRGQEAAVSLARREFLPDVRLMGTYDSFWEESELQPMLGIELNLPLRRARRHAAVEEAEASLERERSERASLEDEVSTSVVAALDRLDEAHHQFDLYRDRLLPAARDQVEAARAAFETGRSDFPALVEAERSLRRIELAAEEAITNLSRREAELSLATGVLPELP